MKTPFLVLTALILTVASCGPVKQHQEKALREDNEKLDQLIAANRADIQSCYKKELAKNPQLGKGDLIVKMDRRIDGTFYNIRELEGFSGSDPVFKCIAQNIGNWKIERYFDRGPIELTWAFH